MGCCTELSLRKDERFSGLVVTRYLASQGAGFYYTNDKNNTPLDLIKNPNLKTKLQTFLPPQNKTATTKVHPCGHLVTCEECSNVPLKRCLRCIKPVTSRSRVGIFLGVPAIDQDIIKNDFPRDTVKQSYQMLCEWFINCKPEKRTVETLRRGLKDAECFAALEYLSLYER
ncbi:E3 ubiquitin-protein ligase MIB2-like isoform X3 [Octopus vulgaris]|uniref:E3 ubiquitin-protein ligase MIB2-like isoform X3 n=1 Tax=Octopus vulgaris TaxID=6645 RepID=A0AA36MI37_OCTVU|nr:E3 ubiquitin-protein ligase MIB2-like isoform X3 [Octopus vulgaris]